MSNKTDAVAQFIANVKVKQFKEAAGLLAEDAVMSVPQIGPIQGRGGVEMALKMASESGRGLERVGWGAPREEQDGTVVAAGKAPPGLLGVVAKLLRKQVAVTIAFGFSDEGSINRLDILTA